MKLSNIINGIELMEICAGANATEKRTEDVIAEYGNIESVCTDSRKCTANSLFIAVKGIDNELVGQIAANIRSLRKPDPYHVYGIRYKDEVVVRKEGKKGTK